MIANFAEADVEFTLIQFELKIGKKRVQSEKERKKNKLRGRASHCSI